MLSLQMDPSTGLAYKGPQRTKRVTEDWARRELYCLTCGKQDLVRPQHHDEPVLDFICSNCNETYELKSKRGRFGGKVTNSAYAKKMEKIKARRNPSFLFLEYESLWRVRNLFGMPRHLFYPEMIVPRKPLAPTAQRHGWVGSIILLEKLSLTSRVYVIKDGAAVPEKLVLEEWRSLSLFRGIRPSLRGWALDLYSLIRDFDGEFTLEETYQFEDYLRLKHPQNRHIKEKIRQQLQHLRNADLVEFRGKGRYTIRRVMTQTKLDTN